MSVIYNFVKLGVCPGILTTEINDSGDFSVLCEYVLIEGLDQVQISMASSVISADLLDILDEHDCVLPEEPSDLGVEIVNGNLVSYSEMSMTFMESQVNNNDWVQIGHANDSISGHVMPDKGIITRVVGHCEAQNGYGEKHIDMYINNTKYDAFIKFGPSSTIINPHDNSGSGYRYDDQWRIENGLSIPFEVCDKIRMRGAMSNSYRLYDTIITVWYKWRL
jgi:hypothetical protein